MERSWIKTKMPEDALELKKNLRCDMKARRNALTDEEKKHAAANCLSKIKRTAGIYECRLDICLYRLPE